MSKRLIMTRGVPGSGKSQWSRQQEGFIVVEKDQIRKELTAKGWTWSRENERMVVDEQERLIMFHLKNGNSVVAADTNFGRHERRLKTLAEKCGAEFSVQDFTTVPLETCLANNRKRAGTPECLDDRIIVRMWKENVEPFLKPEPIVWTEGLPTAIISDIDGTIALHAGRSPYDTARCEEDLLNGPVDALLSAMSANNDVEVIFVTGREERFRPETERWLERHMWKVGTYSKALFMRPTGDFRKDFIIKREIFDKEIRQKYNVTFVVDDRNQTTNEWRRLGLTCLQCAEGAF